ncbi:hypothetical protein B0H13DRAFT_1876662 [Mycena leptocephala]|nr:hypothetical protein B0H13DRAFT_1876662 [Mycena leptocephala]
MLPITRTWGPTRLYPSSSKPDRITAASQAPNRRVSATLQASSALVKDSAGSLRRWLSTNTRANRGAVDGEISPARILIHLNGHAAEELIDRGSMASVRYDRWPENGIYDRRDADIVPKFRKILTTSTSITTDSSTFRDIIIPGRYRISATLLGFLSAGEGLCRKSSPLAVHQHSRPTVEQLTEEISPARILIHLNGHAAEELIEQFRSKRLGGSADQTRASSAADAGRQVANLHCGFTRYSENKEFHPQLGYKLSPKSTSPYSYLWVWFSKVEIQQTTDYEALRPSRFARNIAGNVEKDRERCDSYKLNCLPAKLPNMFLIWRSTATPPNKREALGKLLRPASDIPSPGQLRLIHKGIWKPQWDTRTPAKQ